MLSLIDYIRLTIYFKFSNDWYIVIIFNVLLNILNEQIKKECLQIQP